MICEKVLGNLFEMMLDLESGVTHELIFEADYLDEQPIVKQPTTSPSFEEHHSVDSILDTLISPDLHTNEDVTAYEHVTITWDECSKRILRKTTSEGREIGISLPLGSRLHHGDILWKDPSSAGVSSTIAGVSRFIVVNVAPCEVLAVRPRSLYEMGVLAYEVGNRHLPLAVLEDEILLLVDEPTVLLLEKLDADYTRQVRRFTPLSKGTHPHSHAMEHD